MQRIEHFAKTLKIKGLGPATIEKLDLTSIMDIYDLSLDLLVELLGSSRIAEKLYVEIQKSKDCDLEQLLPAFSIPLIGKTASEKLCKVVTDIEELTSDACVDAGLGPKAAQNLMSWYENEYKTLYSSLPFSFKASKKQVIDTAMGIVCITGKLVSVKAKKDAEQLLIQAGYGVRSSITKDVTILVNESGIESAKTKKARDNGVSIVNNLSELIGV